MNLKVLLPTEVLVDEAVTKVVAEAEDGAFCLLPRHVDFVSALVPGILTFADQNQIEHYVGVGGAILVKTGPQVRVSALYGVRGRDLGTLRQAVAQRFEVLDERERLARSAMAKLEADFLRRFLQYGAESHG